MSDFQIKSNKKERKNLVVIIRRSNNSEKRRRKLVCNVSVCCNYVSLMFGHCCLAVLSNVKGRNYGLITFQKHKRRCKAKIYPQAIKCIHCCDCKPRINFICVMPSQQTRKSIRF